MSLLHPSTPLEGLPWIPSNRLSALRRLGLITLEDLLRHFPRRYEDRRKFDRFPDSPSEKAVCLFGVVKKTSYKRFGPRRIFEAILEDENGGLLSNPLTLRWYNMPWVQKMILNDHRLVVYGKPRERSKRLVIEHPEFEVIEDGGGSSLHFDRITPVHGAGDGLPVHIVRKLVHQALAETDLGSMPRLWPEGFGGVPLLPDVWSAVHFPADLVECERARRELVRDVFFGIQLILSSRRASVKKNGGIPRSGTGLIWKRVEECLPFSLTDSQRDVIGEISTDMASPNRMNRLLQGDVGSGKTMVALHAMIQAHESGWQAALMAPTQILAEQHYLNFRRILDPLGVPVLLRTSSRRHESPGNLDLFSSNSKGPALVVGTHALLFEGAEFERLGLVVIDEQHKFGVIQRTSLIERADAPDVLVMTATPIPRTITQTLYGDLDVSILKHRPSGRGRIVTVVRDVETLPGIVDFLKTELAAGRQAYIVYPLIEESENLDVKAAKAEVEKWRSLLSPYILGIVHGRLDAGSKESVMRDFREGRLSALVATTVIEVGVDVPNATIMIIEEAGRFGLSQLHQLRGRIGRGPEKSWCILLHDHATGPAFEKLQVMEQTSDGFEIAEADLRLRGPGDILGTAQTGLPSLGLGDLLRDADIMAEARSAALALIEQDPELRNPSNAIIRDYVFKNVARQELSAG